MTGSERVSDTRIFTLLAQELKESKFPNGRKNEKKTQTKPKTKLQGIILSIHGNINM